MTRTSVSACLIIIGNEILSGRTRDANLAYIAEHLDKIGVRLREVRVIPDVTETIVATVNAVRANFDYVFTTGGIGPTHDDITAEAIAQAFGVKLLLHPEAARRLDVHYGQDNVNEARRRMAMIPDGAALIDNPISRAPGFRMGNVYVMAGVPAIMQAMFDGIRHQLAGGPPMHSRTVSTSLGEGMIARFLGELQQHYADLEIGSYPFFRRGAVGVSLVMRGTDDGRLDAAQEELRQHIEGLGGNPVVERTSA